MFKLVLLEIWQPQRAILRKKVNAIKFVDDGKALLGGTEDGVLFVHQLLLIHKISFFFQILL
jgi:hypothetical protein